MDAEGYRIVDLQHTLTTWHASGDLCATYGHGVDMQGVKTILPAGTWVLACQVLDEATGDMVKKGELTGYSVMGIRRTHTRDS